MVKKNVNSVIQLHEKTFQEMYVLNTLVKMMKNSCEEKEYGAEYYKLPTELVKKISEERNDYINILTLVSDRISDLMSLLICIEDKLSLLNQDSDNSSRHITAQSPANQGS